jgi:AbrB family looped-hinge helix DNA binding protein
MDAATLSAKFQLVIPRAVRDRYGFRPGQNLQLICLPDRIELIPLQSPGRLRGFLGGVNTFERESDRL